MNDFWVALLLTGIGCLSTVVGGVIAVILPDDSFNFQLLQGFTSGTMLFLSFYELLPESIEGVGSVHATLTFFIGALLIFSLSLLLSACAWDESLFLDAALTTSTSSDPELQMVETTRKRRLIRGAVLMAAGISLHNAPEGISVFLAAMKGGIRLGLPLAVAICAHNLPEGIAVALPVYAATGSRIKGIAVALFSGVFEPLGAIGVSLFFIASEVDQTSLDLSLGAVAGVMTCMVVHETLPLAYSTGNQHQSAVTASIFFGMLFCWISLEAVQSLET